MSDEKIGHGFPIPGNFKTLRNLSYQVTHAASLCKMRQGRHVARPVDKNLRKLIVSILVKLQFNHCKYNISEAGLIAQRIHWASKPMSFVARRLIFI